MHVGLIGPLIHARRVAAGLTVSALADRVGVHSDIVWAVEEGDQQRLDHLPLGMIIALAHGLDLRPSELFADQDAVPATPSPDDVMLEAALLQQGAAVTDEELAQALGWSLARIERALAALHQRFGPTDARLHPVDTHRHVIAPNRHALTVDHWVQLGRAVSGHAPLTVAAATALYRLICLHPEAPPRDGRRWSTGRSPWRTSEWDAADGLGQLREHGLLDGEGPRFVAHRDVRYSLGLDD